LIHIAALVIVVTAGLFFLVLGYMALLAPSRASRFLLAFAGSPCKHYTELAVRLLVGGAFVLSAPLMAFSSGFNFFGWVILSTTAVLFIVPWRLHHRFAQWAVPAALRFLPLLGSSSLTLGCLVIWAVWRGNVA
jgi:hypothetical protein